MADYWADAWCECQKRNSGFYDHQIGNTYVNPINVNRDIDGDNDWTPPAWMASDIFFDDDFDDAI